MSSSAPISTSASHCSLDGGTKEVLHLNASFEVASEPALGEVGRADQREAPVDHQTFACKLLSALGDAFGIEVEIRPEPAEGPVDRVEALCAGIRSRSCHFGCGRRC